LVACWSARNCSWITCGGDLSAPHRSRKSSHVTSTLRSAAGPARLQSRPKVRSPLLNAAWRNRSSGLAKKSAPDIGYGKPPVHCRFKPGQSRDRRGRPKGALTFATGQVRTPGFPLSSPAPAWLDFSIGRREPRDKPYLKRPWSEAGSRQKGSGRQKRPRSRALDASQPDRGPLDSSSAICNDCRAGRCRPTGRGDGLHNKYGPIAGITAGNRVASIQSASPAPG
jgi:hypothetical protein